MKTISRLAAAFLVSIVLVGTAAGAFMASVWARAAVLARERAGAVGAAASMARPAGAEAVAQDASGPAAGRVEPAGAAGGTGLDVRLCLLGALASFLAVGILFGLALSRSVPALRRPPPPEPGDDADRVARLVASARRSRGDLRALVARLHAHLMRKSRELAAAHERFRGVFEQSGVGIALTDLDGRILESNAALQLMLQYDAAELRGRRLQDLAHPEDGEDQRRQMEETRRSRHESARRTKRCIRKDGQVVWVDLIMHILRRPGGEPWMFVGVAVDLTRHRRIEEQLRANRQVYRRLFTEMEHGFALHEMIHNGAGEAVDYRFIEVNPAFERLTGLPADRIVGRTAKQALPNLDAFWIDLYGDVVRTGQPRHVEHFSTALNRWYEVHVYRPSPGRFATLFSDVTARREADARHRQIETRARQTQKQESLGLLASGIAHDFNNLLVSILGHADLAMADLAADVTAHLHLSNIVKASRQAADLCRQMLAYSGRAAFSLSRVDLNRMVRDVARHRHESMPRTVGLHLELDRENPAVDGDLEQLRQALSALLANAAEAIGAQRGVITVRTGVEECGADGPPLDLTGDRRPGGRYAFVEVSDTGCGVEEPALGKIFDPFFSTKAVGRGLGLSTVLGALRAHKGAVRVTSQVGRGATFRLLIPLAAAGAAPARPVAPRAAESAGTGVILVVEPETAVRRAASRALQGAGYRVVSLPSIDEAIDRLRDAPERIDAALVDMDLLIDGAGESLDRLLTLRQDLPILLSNGFTDDEARGRLGEGTPVAGFIRKPYVAEQLLGRMREILAPAAEGR
jgi:PAS domain S-box-containing protein